MGENMWRKKLELLKKRIKEKFIHLAEPMNQVDYTRENYDKLFPDSKVKTPLGELKLGVHQFEKLNVKNRENLLGAMHQTLTDPIVVIDEEKDGQKAKIFSKSFVNPRKPKGLESVVNNIDGKDIVISTHRRDINNMLNKIKKPADLLYEKQTNGVLGAAGNDPECPNLAISGDTQSPINIPQPTHNVNKKNDKNVSEE